jgi:plasmid stabilization system protein ParE
MFQAIRQTVRRLGRFPLSGRRGEIAGTLELVVPNWPYLIVYSVVNEDVQILRVFHTATDWWHARSQSGADTAQLCKADADFTC